MRLIKLFIGIFAVALASITVFNSTLKAKDLSDRLGVGYNAEYNSNVRPVPAISLKYGVSKELHVQADLGFNTADPTQLGLGAKLYQNIFYETNLNFYMAGGVAYLKDAKSGAEFLGVIGAEFFVPGVDSLGFLFEAGVSASNASGTFAIRSVGYSFIDAGIHFYF